MVTGEIMTEQANNSMKDKENASNDVLADAERRHLESIQRRYHEYMRKASAEDVVVNGSVTLARLIKAKAMRGL